MNLLFFPTAHEAAAYSARAREVCKANKVMILCIDAIQRAIESGRTSCELEGDLSESAIASLQAKGYEVTTNDEGRFTTTIDWTPKPEVETPSSTLPPAGAVFAMLLLPSFLTGCKGSVTERFFGLMSKAQAYLAGISVMEFTAWLGVALTVVGGLLCLCHLWGREREFHVWNGTGKPHSFDQWQDPL